MKTRFRIMTGFHSNRYTTETKQAAAILTKDIAARSYQYMADIQRERVRQRETNTVRLQQRRATL